jgi:hypothetical protein
MWRLTIVLAIGCGSGEAPREDAAVADAGRPMDAGARSTSMTIGAAGGTLTTADGVVLEFPPGALAADTVVTVTRVAAPGNGTVGPVFELDPDVEFALPVRLTLAWRTFAGWNSPGPPVVDTESATVSAFVMHFSRWAVIPSSENTCMLDYACFDACCGRPPPSLCCSKFRTSCWCTHTATFPEFVRCYSSCVGTPIASNFANSECMSECCATHGGTEYVGTCLVSTRERAAAVLDCGATCFAEEDETSLCPGTLENIALDACAWQVFERGMEGIPADGCASFGSAAPPDVDLLSEGQTVFFQDWASPPVLSMSGWYSSTTLHVSLACADGSSTDTGAYTATWDGTGFAGTWTFGSRSGEVRIAPLWDWIPP